MRTLLLALLAITVSAADGPTRSGIVSGKDDAALTLVGPALVVGQPAPTATLRDASLAPTTIGGAGGVRVVLSVPSLDTPVCAKEVHAFNERATALADALEVIAVSRDLPFAQKRYCAGQGIERVKTLSDYYDGSFGRAWGLFIAENGLLARAVVVLDRDGVVRYQQIVPKLAQEPDYNAALAAVKAIAAAAEKK